MVRCRLLLVSVGDKIGLGPRKYIFEAQYDQSIPEDQRFCRYTPSGRFEMSVDNPAAEAQFELGKYYYFDAVPVAQ